MRKTIGLLIIFLSLSFLFIGVVFSQKEPQEEKSESAAVEPNYDEVNKTLANTEKQATTSKEKEKVLDQEIKIKIKDTYKATTNFK